MALRRKTRKRKTSAASVIQNKAKATRRIKMINSIADSIQKKSGVKKVVKTTVYKKSRKAALKEAGKRIRKK